MTEEQPSRGPLGALLSGERTPAPRAIVWLTAAILILLVVFHLYTSWFTQIQPYAQRTVCFSLLLAGGFLWFPLGRRSWRDKPNWLFTLDAVCVVLSIGIAIYVMVDFDQFIMRTGLRTTGDYVIGVIAIVLTLELTRRSIGWALVGFALALFVINLFAEYMPGFLFGPNVGWKQLVEIVYLEPSYGILGLPAGVMTNFLIVVFVFVGFLTVSGAGKYFITLASSLAGRFSGGPAKVAVVASTLMGTLSGSALANVGTTGAVTIPLMKKTGYSPQFAGAVEACASSGGQIVPPIMGMVAFLIADILGVNYFEVCLAALIPALLYYAAVFVMVHFEAKRLGLTGLPREQVPSVKAAFAESWPMLLPIAALFYFLMRGYSIQLCVMWAILILFVTTLFRKSTRMKPTSLLYAFEEGGRSSVAIGAVVGCVGIIIGTFYVSGLGIQLADLIVMGAGGRLWLALVYTGIASLILGMGLPTPAAYITVAIIVAPALTKMGANPMAAHLFVFYFAMLSSITPPVAVPAYAAAGIADANPTTTAFTASRIGVASYIVPFSFALAPALVLQGPASETVLYTVSALVGVFLLAAGAVGFLMRPATWMERLLLIAGGICLIIPHIPSDIIGAVMGAVAIVLQKRGAPPLQFALPQLSGRKKNSNP